jgi:hypothetical protein
MKSPWDNEIKPDLQNSQEDFSDENQTKELSKKTKIISLIISLLIGVILLLMSLPSFFNLSNLKRDIELNLAKQISAAVEIRGSTNIEIFPFPSVNIKNVLITNYQKDGNIYNFFAKNIKVRLSILKLLQQEILIKKIIIIKASIEGRAGEIENFKSEDFEIFNNFTLVEIKNSQEKDLLKNEENYLKEDAKNDAQSDIKSDFENDAKTDLSNKKNENLSADLSEENQNLADEKSIKNQERDSEKISDISQIIDDNLAENNPAQEPQKLIKDSLPDKKDDKKDDEKDAAKNNEKNGEILPSQNLAENPNKAFFSTSKIAKNQFEKELMPKIILKKTTLVFHQKNLEKFKFENFESEILIKKNKILAEGSFEKNQQKNDFEINANFDGKINEDNSEIIISSPTFEIIINGSFTSQNNGIINSDFSGKANLKIFDLKNLHRNFFHGNLSVNKRLRDDIEEINISSEIKNNSGEIYLDNINISSDFISGSASAEMDLSNWRNKKIDLQLDLTYLNLDKIFNEENFDTEIISSDLFFERDQGLDYLSHLKDFAIDESNSKKKDKTISNLDITAEINIKEVNIFRKNIANLDLFLNSDRDRINIDSANFEIPNLGKVDFTAFYSITKTSKLPKIIADFKITGEDFGSALKWLGFESSNIKFDYLKNYQIISKLVALPNRILFDQFYLNLNEAKNEFFGKIDYSNNQKTKIFNSFLKITNFNYDDFFLTANSNYYFGNGQLLRKLFWLNDISYENNVKAEIKNFSYNQQKFDSDSQLDFSIGQGFFRINKMNLKSDKNDFTAALNIDISAEKPFLDIKINAKKIDLAEFFAEKKKSENISEKPSEQNLADQIKQDILAEKNDQKNINQSKTKRPNSILSYLLMMPDLDGFEGEINLNFDQLNLTQSSFSDFKFLGKMIAGRIENSNLHCKAYSGNFDYSGLISIKHVKTINGSFILKKIQLSELLNDIIGLDKISANANIVGNINFEAINQDQNLANKIKSEIKFNASDIKIKSFGLANLVNKMFYANSYRNELLEFEKVIFNKALDTSFSKANGEIEIKKNQPAKIFANLSAPAINQVLSGKIDFSKNNIDAISNIIFITGSSQKTIPINIAIAMKGNFNNLNFSNNFDQIRSYLGLEKHVQNPSNTSNNLPKLISGDVEKNENEKSVIIQPNNQSSANQQIEKIKNIQSAQ